MQAIKSLKPYNTFGIDVKANRFIDFNSIENLINILQLPEIKSSPILVIGGGSNILFTKDFEGTVLHNCIGGIEVNQINESDFLVTAGAGVIWHQLVLFCLDKNLGGIENLSLIPGYVGASPMQNIGAYGVEIKDVFHELTALEIATGNTQTFSKSDCKFGYRESIFKHELKNKYIITSVTFKLSLNHQLNTSYGAIETELDKLGLSITIQNISKAICNIRQSKLPNPAEIGNAGSFFKNPTVSQSVFNVIKQTYPDMPSYQDQLGNAKLAAGWLIEQCGLKGIRKGDAGIHKLQALVLVNYGNSTGQEIYDLSEQVLQTVKQKFGITLEREVNIF